MAGDRSVHRSHVWWRSYAAPGHHKRGCCKLDSGRVKLRRIQPSCYRWVSHQPIRTKIAGNGDSTRLYQALRANDRERFIQEVQQKYKHCPSRRKTIKAGYQYILSNWDGVHETLTRPDAASSTEGHVSHMLSERMSSRGMGWSLLGAEQIARMRTYVANGGDLIAYFCCTTCRKPNECAKI